MALLGSQPDSWNPVSTFSVSAGTCSGIAQKKCVPKDLSGAIIDLTGYNTASLTVSQSGPFYPDAVASYPLTIGTADSTGIVLSATPAEALAALSGNFAVAPKMFVTVGNGTDTLLAATGTLVANILP